MPEVQGLVEFLDQRARGLVVEQVVLASYAALKTVDPPIASLVGLTVAGAARHGKFLDLACGQESHRLHLVLHLARAGWVRWYEELPDRAIRPGRSPIALRLALSDGSGFDATEAGTTKRLAIHVVARPEEVPGIAALGPDPLAPGFTLAQFAAVLRGRRTQVKGLLRDQSLFAGIGNAWSDEILHAARLSPYALAAGLSEDAVARLYHAVVDVLGSAVREAAGRPPAELKDAKRSGLRIHGHTGEPCPVCGDTIRQVVFADSSLQYCPACQTGGKPLADRALSRLLK